MTGAFIVYSILTSVLIDFFQPLSLYDVVIYLALAALALLLIFMVSAGISGLFRKKISIRSLLLNALVFLFLMQFYGLASLQKDFEYTNIEGEAAVVFDAGEGGYKIFRIPTVLILPEASRLHDGSILEQDRIIVMAGACSLSPAS